MCLTRWLTTERNLARSKFRACQLANPSLPWHRLGPVVAAALCQKRGHVGLSTLGHVELIEPQCLRMRIGRSDFPRKCDGTPLIGPLSQVSMRIQLGPSFIALRGNLAKSGVGSFKINSNETSEKCKPGTRWCQFLNQEAPWPACSESYLMARPRSHRSHHPQTWIAAFRCCSLLRQGLVFKRLCNSQPTKVQCEQTNCELYPAVWHAKSPTSAMTSTNYFF